MSLLEVTTVTGLSVLTGTVAVLCLCVERRQLHRTTDEFTARFRDVAPYLAVAAAFLLLKQATHGYRLRLSRALNWNVTDELYAVEGEFVATLQHAVPPAALEFFSATYVLGFAFLLVTAPLLYFLSSSQRRLKELLVAYVVNYGVGSVCYTLFVAYGPRNHLPSVEGLMYEFYPATQTLTAAVSSNTNVFPSLHTSLAAAVALVAWRSRREHPRWFAIVAFVATSVVISTMYLGIHWLADVVAGLGLGWGSVRLAGHAVAYAEARPSAGTRRDRVGIDGDD
ncbi:phosphatase PAP2 family protein [Halorubrum amylolyticum]|uniref:phosphatase PAP2 family protein n=1 Tax=Halorubrum amylolyticum TaxID=2508724 RepID=UPI001008CEE9|nr:phosphatase PAP2 family protein [Halorubrum amylolyticum]